MGKNKPQMLSNANLRSEHSTRDLYVLELKTQNSVYCDKCNHSHQKWMGLHLYFNDGDTLQKLRDTLKWGVQELERMIAEEETTEETEGE